MNSFDSLTDISEQKNQSMTMANLEENQIKKNSQPSVTLNKIMSPCSDETLIIQSGSNKKKRKLLDDSDVEDEYSNKRSKPNKENDFDSAEEQKEIFSSIKCSEKSAEMKEKKQ